MEKQENIILKAVDAFEDFADWLDQKGGLKALKALFFLGATAVLCLIVFFGYRVVTQLDLGVGILKEANPSPEEMQKLLEETTRQNVLIEKVLTDDLLPVAGERAYLIRFHNGSRDINGTHFMFMSTSNEVTKEGISNEINQFQRIPTSIIPATWIQDLLEDKCVVQNPDDIEVEVAKRLLLSMGIKTLKVCPITDLKNGNLLGVVGLSWVTYEPAPEECTASDNAMRKANAKLSGILSLDN